MNAQHLSMSEEEFANHCNGLVDINTSNNVLKTIHSNLKILSELRDKQRLLRLETSKLKSDFDSFRKETQSKFHACLYKNKDKYTSGVSGFCKNVIDGDDHHMQLINEAKLSEPLKPLPASASSGLIADEPQADAAATTDNSSANNQHSESNSSTLTTQQEQEQPLSLLTNDKIASST